MSITVNTSSHSYEIKISENSIKEIELVIKNISKEKQPKVCILIDEIVLDFHKNLILNSFKEIKPSIISIPSGEKSKSIEVVYPIYKKLIEENLDRNSFIIGIGGGVVGDTAGFIASTFLRGVNFIQVPTTLLAMVDSSIGGKVGINHELGKNLIGSFYPPKAVIIDPIFLKTLPTREAKSGLSECLKHGIISGEKLFNSVVSAPTILESTDSQIIEFIKDSIIVKKIIVEEDEKETGSRAYLNLGHTFAHAIEAYSGYGSYLHGEAVGLGIICCLRLSEIKFGLTNSHRKSCEKYLQDIGLPTKLNNLNVNNLNLDEIINIMSRDKKKENGKINFVLVKDLGQIVTSNDLRKEDIRNSLQAIS